MCLAKKEDPIPATPAAQPTETAMPASRKPASPDAIALLKQDHKDVKALFKQYEDLVKQDAEGE
jgi:hypothetical protein